MAAVRWHGNEAAVGRISHDMKMRRLGFMRLIFSVGTQMNDATDRLALAPKSANHMVESLTIRRPDDWHLHFRDGDTMRAQGSR